MLENMQLIIFLMSILGCSVVANIIAGIQLNVNEIEMKFDKKILFKGILRAIFISIVVLLLTVVVSYLPEVLNNANITIVSEEATDLMSILAIVIIIVSAIIKYFKDALDKLKIILNLTEDKLIDLKYEKKATDHKDRSEIEEEKKN